MMLNEEFKYFYKIEMQKRQILELLLKKSKGNLVLQLINDSCYIFNKRFIFDYILQVIKDRENSRAIDEFELK
jgi:hypothetical protein